MFGKDFDEHYYDFNTYKTLFVLHDHSKLTLINSVLMGRGETEFFKRYKFLEYVVGAHDISFNGKVRKCRPVFWYWDFNISRIRNYYGEDIGLYFAFSRHYTAWLSYLSVFSLAIQFWVFLTGQYVGTIVGLYACCVVSWGCLMIRLWSSEEAELALMWGVWDLTAKEKVRPDYQKLGDEDAVKRLLEQEKKAAEAAEAAGGSAASPSKSLFSFFNRGKTNDATKEDSRLLNRNEPANPKYESNFWDNINALFFGGVKRVGLSLTI